MRLTTKEIDIIKTKVKVIFGDALVYLFGSRACGTQDNKRTGGDIDLYIVSKTNENLFQKKQKLKIVLEDTLYKPVDVIVSITETRLIEQEAIKYGILL